MALLYVQGGNMNGSPLIIRMEQNKRAPSNVARLGYFVDNASRGAAFTHSWYPLVFIDKLFLVSLEKRMSKKPLANLRYEPTIQPPR